LIDRSFRIVMAEPIEAAHEALDRLQAELAREPALPEGPFAPVLVLPRIFEPSFCEALIAYFEAGQAEESGFAAEVEGRTVTVVNAALKRRQDVSITDEGMIEAVRDKLKTRLSPMVERAFGWTGEEIERFLITAYAEHDQGFFSAHRDDVTAGTAHRKFAVSINLNAEDFTGGDLRFPEFGRRLYRPPTGGAAVFSCRLLHEVTPVTRGVRYALVPFLYDEAGARVRRANLALVGAGGQRRDRPQARRR
jgi:predicted 2-oxoglutarate/Fe(II)-dependent dioxygenase YbiX